MPLLQTSGNVTADGYGGGVAAVPNYIEDVFNTYVWTGTGSNQTLTTNVDTSTYGGLFWTKNRTNAYDHALWSTNFSLSGNYLLKSNTTGALTYGTYNTGDYVSNSTTGVTVYGNSSQNYVTWTFRKQAKFFDVVTYSGTGSATTIAHSLGSVPGCIIVKNLDAATNWAVYHRSLGGTYITRLNRDWASDTGYENWANTNPTSTVFTVGNGNATNGSGYNYVAYVFAHDAGGFGLTGTDNVISCGSFTTDGSGAATISLGYEPQWVMTKRTDSTGPWGLYDTMRGWSLTAQNYLLANDSGAEGVINATGFAPNATGFTTSSPFDASATYIYIAIRRGPMKVPTSGTSVFLPTSRTGNASLTTITSGFAPDVVLSRRVDNLDNGNESVFADKLRGSGTLSTNNTAAEYAGGATSGLNSYTNTGIVLGTNNNPIYAFNYATLPYATYQFQRAPSFFDEVCFNGSDTDFTVNHNLQAIPELIILKKRSGTGSWFVGGTIVGFNSANNNNNLFLNNTNAVSTATVYTATWTSSAMYMSGGANFVAGTTAVAYLFATCAGVSKVGSYTGNGSTQTINCGFTGGARFVLIKRTDSTGDWYVYDTARGMTTLTDPYVLLNSTAAQTATLGSVTTVSTGFAVNASILAAINTNAASYIFLAIA